MAGLGSKVRHGELTAHRIHDGDNFRWRPNSAFHTSTEFTMNGSRGLDYTRYPIETRKFHVSDADNHYSGPVESVSAGAKLLTVS